MKISVALAKMYFTVDIAAVQHRAEHLTVKLREVDAISNRECPKTPVWDKAEEVSPDIFCTPALFPQLLRLAPVLAVVTKRL